MRLLDESDITKYVFEISVENSLYEGQSFLLQVLIDNDYPVQPPLVQFITRDLFKIPLHPHVYLNGHICLNVVGKDWTPALSVETTVLSVQSMLSTNSVLERPPDDDAYSKSAPINPKSSSFVYHDDGV